MGNTHSVHILLTNSLVKKYHDRPFRYGTIKKAKELPNVIRYPKQHAGTRGSEVPTRFCDRDRRRYRSPWSQRRGYPPYLRKKNEPEFLLSWRLSAYRHWLTLRPPTWANVSYPPIDYQSISYFSSPKSRADQPKSLDEADPKLLETYDKLGVPLHERAALAGVAVDAVFDSVSVGMTFKAQLSKAGVIFCSFSEGVQPKSCNPEMRWTNISRM